MNNVKAWMVIAASGLAAGLSSGAIGLAGVGAPMASEDWSLQLRAGPVSTVGGAGNLAALAGTTPTTGRYVIQLDGPMTPARRTDLLDAGVEIVAQPPGKRLINLEAMSGGEKTMTAVTLLFALFMHKPSPFCLLDEVEAALDEANVIRLVELVRDLTDRSQFIMITHNKRTMSMADVLFGVTMQEPGVSKLVGVKIRKDETRDATAVA